MIRNERFGWLGRLLVLLLLALCVPASAARACAPGGSAVEGGEGVTLASQRTGVAPPSVSQPPIVPALSLLERPPLARRRHDGPVPVGAVVHGARQARVVNAWPSIASGEAYVHVLPLYDLLRIYRL